jgi:hypothetical protein
MSLLPRSLAAIGALVYGLFFCAALAGAQPRFTVLTRDAVGVTPGLQIVTIHDAVQETCYLLFVVETPGVASGGQGIVPPDIAVAAAQRDNRLARLSRDWVQSFGSLYAGTPANPLPYEFEAQKIQNEFQQAVRENELAWMADQLERIAMLPKVAVSGPAPCVAVTQSAPVKQPVPGRQAAPVRPPAPVRQPAAAR